MSLKVKMLFSLKKTKKRISIFIPQIWVDFAETSDAWLMAFFCPEMQVNNLPSLSKNNNVLYYFFQLFFLISKFKIGG